MRTIGTMLLAAFAALLVMAGSAFAERRVALVMGNGTYQNAAKLINPGNDAGAMAALFNASAPPPGKRGRA
jgi:hypothetical protein